jgi:hypothetical protein
MSVYEQLQKLYPDKVIKLVLKKFEEQYKQWGFKTIYNGTQKSIVNSQYDINYVFMIEA